ncbi:MAG: hypothetical protein DRN04_16720 [Thermoprotei archaeon]|nr:MAG: hypothetical protein DRN04_16720 [Thermoprotei archaeon]
MKIIISDKLRKIKFRCVKCGNCCKAFLYTKWKLELYSNEVQYLEKIGYRNFYHIEEGCFYMNTNSHGCVFLKGNRCGLLLRHKWYPWNCSLFPIQLVKKPNTIELRLNPAAEKICNGIGYGKPLNTRVKEVVKQVKYFIAHGEPSLHSIRFY